MTDEKQNRTCPPPTPVKDLAVGDRVMYQVERMKSEEAGVIAGIGGEFGVDLITLESGRSFPASVAYVRKIDADRDGDTTDTACQPPKSWEDCPKRRVYTTADKRTAVTQAAKLIVAGSTVQDALEQVRASLGIPFPDSAFYRWRKELGADWEKLTGKSADEKVRRPVPSGKRKRPQRPPEPPQEAQTDRGAPEKAQEKMLQASLKRLRYIASRVRNVMLRDGDPNVVPSGEVLRAAALVAIAEWDDQDRARHGEAPDVDTLMAFYEMRYGEVEKQPDETVQPPMLHEGPDLLARRLEVLTAELAGKLRECAPTMARAAAVIATLEG